MTDIIAKVIADSIGEHSPRLVSMQTRAPKFIHQETLRHRRIYIADVLVIDPDFSFSVSSSLESARWYWARLCEMARGNFRPAYVRDQTSHAIVIGEARTVKSCLEALLTPDELALLNP